MASQTIANSQYSLPPPTKKIKHDNWLDRGLGVFTMRDFLLNERALMKREPPMQVMLRWE